MYTYACGEMYSRHDVGLTEPGEIADFRGVSQKNKENQPRSSRNDALAADLGAVTLWQHHAKKASVYVKINLVKQLLLERRRNRKRKGRALPGLSPEINFVTT
ncbi:hypothetical protein [Mesorhizobium sp. NZP2298]|uniref:hypothetical protein n=1 Tax=Mesorhizobium sp. NZP2298 TaxID=2483403 RepID=UPI001552B509|nr:hypothetical protein [Mesorhizobium sp. NZP2298]